MKKILKEFIQDFRNYGAIPNAERIQLSNLWTILLFIASSVTAFIDNTVGTLSKILTIDFSIAPIILIIIGIFFSIHVISAKNEILNENNSGDAISTINIKYQYNYNNFIRKINKYFFCTLIILLPYSIINYFNRIESLPEYFYGYVFDEVTQEPIQDVTVRVLSIKGTDVTDGFWKTDSEGFYVVKTIKKVNQFAEIKFSLPNCQETITAKLTKNLQIRIPNNDLNPIYSHHLKKCKE